MTLCTNNTPSQNEYTGNGAITEYSITFQYYSQSDIFVAFYNTATEAWVNVSTSDWSFLNPTVIKFNTAPADNQRILIYRCTDIDPLPAEFFPGTSIKAADLNNNFFVMKSAIEEINTQAGSSDTLAQSAKATADAANTKADTAISTANTANTTANSAATTANSIQGTATSALTTANAADTKADTAIATANTASTNASSAVTTANTADTNATNAVNTANTALSTANTANTTANNALSQVSAANPWTESSGVVSLNNSGSSVGIGTSSANRNLVVNSSTGNAFIAARSNDAQFAGILFGDQSADNRGQISYANTSDSMQFLVAATERVRITSTGLVGVGTSSPTTNFEVVSSLAQIKGRSTGATSPSRLQLDNVAGNGVSGGQIVGQWDGSPVARIDFKNGDRTERDDGAITFHTSASNNSAGERMRITPVGRLGIGTNAPTRNVVVNDPSGNSWVSVRSSDTGRAGILLGDQTSDGMAQLAYDNNNEVFQFVSAGSERMRLTAVTGGTRLGIGTSSPKRMLHVNNATTHAFGTITSDNASFAGILFGNQTDDARGQIFYNNSTDEMSFVTNNTYPAKMTISQTGVVDINGSLNVNGQAITPGGGGSSTSGYVNVKDFGAVGNGTTDDTTAVTNALNGGGTVYFPAGTYRITSTLSHTTAFNVVGDGQQSRIMYDASSNNTNLFFLSTNVRHDNDKKWSFNNIALSCKAVTNRVHGAGIRIRYNGPATVIGGTNYLELNDVHIVSEITTDATQAYFKYGLQCTNIGGIVANNLNISTFNLNAESNVATQGIRIENSISGHAVIRAFTGTNIYLQRYYKGLYATKAGGGQNIESIYMTQGEIVCHLGIHLEASHATFISGMHFDCKEEAYMNTSDGGPHRVVGCDLRGGRNGTLNLTNYLIKIGVDNCSFTGNYITAQMPSAGCIRTGGPLGNPDNVSIVGNIFNGNGSSTYRALSCESGSSNVMFSANIGSGFGGNSNPVVNQIGTGQGQLNNTTNEFL